MLFTNEQYNYIYTSVYDWLVSHTPGGRCHISSLKIYQKQVWNPIIEMIEKLTKKETLNDNEQEFLDKVVYNGPIYRIQNYNSRYKGYIHESGLYQSWSMSIEGVESVSNFIGDVVLIVGQANNGIDLFGLLTFLLKNKYITFNRLRDPYTLCRYEDEKEVVYPVQFKNINEVAVVDKDNLHDWENHKKDIPRDKWKRNSVK